MTPEPPHTGLLAEFETADALVAAIDAARCSGFTRLDAFTPYPINAVGAALGLAEDRIGPAAAVGGAVGFLGMLSIEVGTSLAYPLDIGGRPLLPWPAFLVPAIEMLILFACLFAVVAMLRLNGLPQLHAPVLGAARFAHATDDRFFLLIGDDDVRFAEARRFFEGRNPFAVVST